MRTILAILGTLVVVAVALLAIVGPRMGAVVAALGAAPSATEVRVAEVGEGTVVEVISAPGVVEPFRKVDISAEVSARIVELYVREGGSVRAGEVVIRLDDRDLRAGLDSATARRDAERFRLQSEQARLAGPVAQLDYARKTLERNQQLLASGDVSQQVVDENIQRVADLESSVDSIRQNIAVLESSLAAADAEIERAQQAVRRTVITSPRDGVVTRLNAEVGELVLVGTMNNPGTVILTVADLSRMLLKAEVAESDVARLLPGQRSRIHINAYPDAVFGGVLQRVDLQRTNPQAGSASTTPYFETEIDIELEGRQILSGLAANVDIEVESHTGFVIPSQAILQRPLDELPLEVRDAPAVDASRRIVPVVYRMVEGAAVCTPVRIGASDLTQTIVREGVSSGDIVVVGPFKVLEKLKHGDRIRREGTGPASAPAAGGESGDDDDATGVEIRL